MTRLKSKVAIITGAVRGIGRSIALELVREGASVVIDDRDIGDSERLLSEIEGLGGRAEIVEIDVSHCSHHERLIGTALESFGGLDILVNNAGVNVREPFLQARQETWDEILNVNLKGPFFLSQMAARAMAARGGGGL